MSILLLALTTAELTPYVLMFGAFASICAVLTFLWKMLSALVGIRSAIGTKNPREGLLGDVEDIKDKQEEITKQQSEADKTLAVIEANVAQRRQTDKRGT